MSNNPLDAYKAVENSSIGARDLEANVLMRAATQLAEVQRNWEGAERDSRLLEALRYNQRLWTLFQVELAASDNPLPIEIRQNLLRLSSFIDKRTLEVLSHPDAAKLDVLININMNVAGGLRGQ